MPTSDEELAKLQTEVAEKRQRLADARLTRESNERALANDVTAAQLLAESAQLDVLIANEERVATEEAVKAGAAGLMETVTADVARAQAMQQGAEELVAAQEANQKAVDEAKAQEEANAQAAAEAAATAALQSEADNTAEVAGGAS